MMASFPWSYWLGIALFLWLFVDLIRGEVYLWQAYQRATEPGMYWFCIALWAIVAISCFIYPNWSLS